MYRKILFTLLVSLLFLGSCEYAFAQTNTKIQRRCPGAAPSVPFSRFELVALGDAYIVPCFGRSVFINGTSSAGLITSINGLTGPAITLATGTSGTNFAVANAGSTITFNLPTASSVNRGALSAADWTTFNSKLSTGTLTTNFFPVSNGAASIQNSPMSWNGTLYTRNNTALNSEVTETFTPSLTGSFSVGDFTTTPTTYFSQDYNGGNTDIRSSGRIRLGNQSLTTSFTLDAAAGTIEGLGPSGITLDSAGGQFVTGDASATGNGTKIIIDDSSQIITTTSTTTEINTKGGQFSAGDVNTVGNETKIGLDDGAGTITLRADSGIILRSNQAGESSALYLDASKVVTGAALTNGQLLIGQTGDVPLGRNLTAGAGVTVTNGAGSITIAATGGHIETVPINNTVLANATGTVFASACNIGTPLTITSEAVVSCPVTRAGTLRNLFVRTGTTAKVGTPTTTVTVRKNGVDTTITLTMTETTATTTSDTTHSVSVAQGDLVTVSLSVSGPAAVSTSIAGIRFQID